MKLKIFITLILLIITATVFAQTSDDWVKQAVTKVDNKDYNGAMADCNQALQINSQNAWAYNIRGITKHNTNRSSEAITDYDQAIALSANYKQAWFNRGLAKAALGMPKPTPAAMPMQRPIMIRPLLWIRNMHWLIITAGLHTTI
jgi:tetratricopeptide (TPR) repeat protein